MAESAETLLGLFGIVLCGLLLGKVSLRGISLGTSGVVFAGLAAGHLGFAVPKMTGVVGIVLFVYCLGLGAGPGFLRMFFAKGKPLLAIALLMILVAAGVAWLLAKTLHITPDLASGIFAGALTSTPALAAATEQLSADSDVAVGFGIAYPFGVVGVILFAQIIPKLFTSTIESGSAASPGNPDATIARVLVHVVNPAVVGRQLRDVAVIAHTHCQVSRIEVEGSLQPIPSKFRLDLGQRLLIVGTPSDLEQVAEVLGERCLEQRIPTTDDDSRRRIVATSQDLVGQSLADLHLRSKFGTTISRIARQDVEFVPSPRDRIQFGDILTAVGQPDDLRRFVAFAGHRERTLDETDLISLAMGLGLGVLVGGAQLTFGGESISLGLAGGPLLVGLLIGHFGKLGPLSGRIPRAARLLLADVGLILFLAQAGSQAGGQFVGVIREHGTSLCGAATAVVIAPIVAGILLARFVWRLDPLEAAGGICGAMTSTPGLGAIASKTDSSVPATSYATVYPLALILITMITPILISQMTR